MTLFGYGLWNAAACNEDHVARNDKAQCARLLNLHIAIYSTDLEPSTFDRDSIVPRGKKVQNSFRRLKGAEARKGLGGAEERVQPDENRLTEECSQRVQIEHLLIGIYTICVCVCVCVCVCISFCNESPPRIIRGYSRTRVL